MKDQGTQSREKLLRALKVLIAAVLTLLVMAVIFLELFGYLWFAGIVPIWKLVPPLTLIGLLGMLRVPLPWRRLGAVSLLAIYGVSLCMDGWDDLVRRYESGSLFFFSVLEMALVAVLAIPSVMPNRIRMNS